MVCVLLSSCGEERRVAEAADDRDATTRSNYRFDVAGRRATTVPIEEEGEDEHLGAKRVEIARDALECKVLVGLTRHETRRLLGAPTYAMGRHWEYYLAPDVIDNITLYIEFDEKGRMAGGQIGQS